MVFDFWWRRKEHHAHYVVASYNNLKRKEYRSVLSIFNTTEYPIYVYRVQTICIGLKERVSTISCRKVFDRIRKGEQLVPIPFANDETSSFDGVYMERGARFKRKSIPFFIYTIMEAGGDPIGAAWQMKLGDGNPGYMSCFGDTSTPPIILSCGEGVEFIVRGPMNVDVFVEFERVIKSGRIINVENVVDR